MQGGYLLAHGALLRVSRARGAASCCRHASRIYPGRSSLPSLVFLIRDRERASNEERLQILESTEDGFRIAEEDLALRGPGDLLGMRQSGRASYELMQAPGFSRLLSMAREAAREQVRSPGFLSDPQNAALRLEVERRVDLRAGADAG